jgi:LacI family transcriptional regulator
VREAMRDIGYVYNRAAAVLRGTSVGLVGLVINDLRNPFFAEFAVSFQMAMAARGYATVVSNADEDDGLQEKLVASMIEHGVDAVVISPAYGDPASVFDPLAKAGIPVMQVLRRMDARTDRFPFSSFDYAAGSAEATRHLIATGAKRIAFVGGLDERSITQERMAGYLAALAGAGLKPLRVAGPTSRAFGRSVASGLRRDHPDCDAVFCFNDLVALGLIAGLQRDGVAVGRDYPRRRFRRYRGGRSGMARPVLGLLRYRRVRTGDGARPAGLAGHRQISAPAERRAKVSLKVRGSSRGVTP